MFFADEKKLTNFAGARCLASDNYENNKINT